MLAISGAIAGGSGWAWAAMVAGVAVGKRVQALAHKAKTEGWCKGKWPGTWKVEVLTGKVVEKVGRKWKVLWDEHAAGTTVLGARLLQWASDGDGGGGGGDGGGGGGGDDGGVRADGAPDPRAVAPAPVAAAAAAAGRGAPAGGGAPAAGGGGVPAPAGGDEHEEHDEVDDAAVENPPFDAAEAAGGADAGADELRPHGLQWALQADGIPMEAANISTQSPELIWPDRLLNNHRPALEYFFLFFPMACVATCLELTSEALVQANRRALTEQELFQYIGVMFICSLYKDIPLEELFNGVTEGFVFEVSPMLKQFMSFTRFCMIGRYLTFARRPQTPAERERAGDFWAVQPLVDAFNERRREVYRPGHKLVVDESFSPWRGRDERHLEHGCPHVQKEKRKPKGVGMEIKNVACVTAGIMLVLELVASANEMHTREHWREGFASTALLLRLLHFYGGSRRIVLGDSAFASVQTAVALFKRLGLFFIGMVKSCTRKYPFQFTQEYEYPHRGAHIALTANTDDVDVRAVAWGDRKVKSFVSTCGTSLPGAPHKKRRWRNNNNGTTEYFTRDVPRPRVAVEYFDGAQVIDVHNHARQGSGLGLEMRGTSRWQVRLFQTIVGICEVDAHHAFTYFTPHAPTHRDFIKSIAAGLLDNVRGGATAPLRPPLARRQTAAAAAGGSPESRCLLRQLASTAFAQQQKRAREEKGEAPSRTVLRCRMCSNRSAFYCHGCSDMSDSPAARKLQAVCGPRTGRDCFREHRLQMAQGEDGEEEEEEDHDEE